MKRLVIVPAKNEGKSIRKTLEQLVGEDDALDATVGQTIPVTCPTNRSGAWPECLLLPGAPRDRRFQNPVLDLAAPAPAPPEPVDNIPGQPAVVRPAFNDLEGAVIESRPPLREREGQQLSEKAAGAHACVVVPMPSDRGSPFIVAELRMVQRQVHESRETDRPGSFDLRANHIRQPRHFATLRPV